MAFAQARPTVIKLDQTTGKFEKEEPNTKARQIHFFKVTNVGVDHEVGL